MKRPSRAWNLSKISGKLGATVNVVPGVFSLTAEMGLEADRKVDVLASAKKGFSACNIGDDVAMLDLLVGTLIKVETQTASAIQEAIEEVGLSASMLETHHLKTLEFRLKNLPEAVLVVLSVLLSVGKVLGRESAVQVTRSFLEKVAKADTCKLPLKSLGTDTVLKSLIQDVSAGGPTWVNNKAAAYDKIMTRGEEIWGSWGVELVTFGMMASLIWWLYQCIVKVDSDGPAEVQAQLQICKTYDSRLHKVVYLLEQFGWPVHAALNEREDDFAGFRRVMFQANMCPEKGVEEMPLLPPEEVEQHGRRVPWSGSGTLCKYKDIGKVLRARIGSANRLGCNLESGWELGWSIGISRAVVIGQDPKGDDVIRVSLQKPSVPAGDDTNLGCENLVNSYIGGVDNYIKVYAGLFHRMYNGTRKEYETYELPVIVGINEERVPKPVRPRPNLLQVALVGFGLGYLCGSVFSMASEMNIFAEKDDVYLSWLENMDEFRADLVTSLRDLKENGMTLGGCLDLIAACFYGESDRLIVSNKKSAVADTCVGTWAGDKVLLLDAVMNPVVNYDRPNCNVQELSVLPINIPCPDGKYIVGANVRFNSSRIQGEMIQNQHHRIQPQIYAMAKEPSTEVSFTIGPNLINNDGSVMHCMYAGGRLIHYSSVLEAIPRAKIWAPAGSCPHQGSDKSMFVARNDRQAYPVSDTDLIDMGVLTSPFYTDGSNQGYSHGKHLGVKEGVVLVQVAKNESWRYTAASMYRDHNRVMLGGAYCLACAGIEYRKALENSENLSYNQAFDNNFMLPFDVIIL